MKLSLNQVTFSYKNLPAVDHASLEFSENGLILIVGPNGSGKSTLLKLLAGLSAPTSGKVIFDDRDLQRMNERDRARRIAWMSQSPTAVPKWPLYDYVLTGRYPYRKTFEPFNKDDHGRTAEVLERLAISHLAARTLEAISGGELQLARIARALLQETPVLLLDEPFAPLDIRHRAAVWTELNRTNRTTIAVSHDLSMIGRGLRRLILMRAGKILADGEPAEVLTAANIRSAYDWSPPSGWTFTPSDFLEN